MDRQDRRAAQRRQRPTWQREIAACGRRVRTETGLGQRPTSVAGIALSLANRVFETLAGRRVLLLGAGETVELTARLLVDEGVTDLRQLLMGVGSAAVQVVTTGTPEQVAAARTVLTNARRELYLILAEDAS